MSRRAFTGNLRSCGLLDAVRVMNPIQTETKGVKPLVYSGGNDLSYYTYLKKVRYQVRAHFEFNLNHPELEKDRNEHKHHNIARRMDTARWTTRYFPGNQRVPGIC